MTAKRFKVVQGYNDRYCQDTATNKLLNQNQTVELLNNIHDENEQLKSVNQELRTELQFDAKQYKVFIEVINEADDLICSHLSKHYQRKWKNFCKSREIDV